MVDFFSWLLLLDSGKMFNVSFFFFFNEATAEAKIYSFEDKSKFKF